MIIAVILISCSNRRKGELGQREKQEKAITVMVQEMQPGNLEKYIRVTGKLEGIIDVTMRSETNGKVLEILKKLGDWVNASESIGRIDNSDYQNQLDQAEANLMAAEANYETAEIQMNVSEKLYEENKVSESEYLQAKSSLKAAEASLKGAVAGVETARKTFNNSQFIASVSGYISEFNLEIGEYISAGSVVANIVNIKKLLIKTGVGESDVNYIKKGNSVIIAYYGEDYPARVTGIGIKPVTGGHNYPVEIELDNKDNKLLPGMIVEGRIHAKTFENVIYTSIENLREQYDQSFVYVINDENRAELHIVELGEKVNQNIILISGIQVGDKLVIDGIDSLIEGSLVDMKTGFADNGK